MNTIKYNIRNLLKNKLYTGINILGLAVGIASILLIYKIVSHELSYNKNFKNYDRIVRVLREENNPESGIELTAGNPQPAMEVLKTAIPQFEKTVRIRETWPMISVPDGANAGMERKKFELDPGQICFLVEPSYFEIFDYDWLAGSAVDALEGSNKIVLTKSLALKAFGTIDAAMGKLVSTDNQSPYLLVTGVVDDKKGASDLPVLAFISYATIKLHPQVYNVNDDWGSNSSNDQFYALLTQNHDFNTINKSLADIGQVQYKAQDAFNSRKHIAQPFSDLHFDERVSHSGTHTTSKKKLKILSFVGLLIIVMACFNFINMANAQSILRAKEIGIRKTLGVKRTALVSNFLLETGLLVIMATSIGIGLAYLLSPFLYTISSLPKSVQLFDQWQILTFIGLLILIITLLAGLYPAMVLSSFKPIEIFKSGFGQRIGQGVSLRKILMVLQFLISFALIVSTIIAMSQMNFIKNMGLGFNKDLIYTFGFNNDSSSLSRLASFKNELLKVPDIESVSFSSDRPSSDNTWSSNWRYGNGAEDAPFSINLKFCDQDYQKTYDLKLLAGRWMHASDTMNEVVLNKTALNKVGITDYQQALGQSIGLGGRRGLICVGVVDDYHSHSAHEPIVPVLMTTRKRFYYIANVKLESQNISKSIAAMEASFNKQFPDYVFTGRFYDELIQQFYESDKKYFNLCKGFSILAILISCLGLFALASFGIARRVREIGIRKVLGASTSGLVSLITKEFIILISVAFLIAAPIAYYFMNKWLQDFVYRTAIKWWMFALSLVLIMLISFGTIAIQAIKAAWANPTTSLRSE